MSLVKNKVVRFTKPAKLFLIIFFSAYQFGLGYLSIELLDISIGL